MDEVGGEVPLWGGVTGSVWRERGVCAHPTARQLFVWPGRRFVQTIGPRSTTSQCSQFHWAALCACLEREKKKGEIERFFSQA